ncbi:MAG: ComF family protein, partial [Muribaculaceae bacterium]|nr:ComF family protein [Muribaculaceae bacterium]
MKLSDILQATADIFMPRVCPVCGKVLDGAERYICRKCLMNLPRTGFEELPLNSMVQRFAGKVPVERATAYFFYERNAPYSQILQDIKYRNVPSMGR